MLHLPNSVFNRSREFLNFHDLHASRPVSKKWNDISSVQKILSMDESEPIPPPHSDFSRITSISIWWNSYEERQYPLINDCILHIFKDSSNHLRLISLDSPRDFEFPSTTFSNLEHLSLGFIDGDFASKAITCSSNIKILNISYVEQGRLDIDFEKLPRLKKVHFQDAVLGNITNGHKCSMEIMDLMTEEPENHTLADFWRESFLENLKEIKIHYGFLEEDRPSLDAWTILPKWIERRRELAIKTFFSGHPYAFLLRTCFKDGTLMIDSCGHFMTSDLKQIVEIATKFSALLEKWNKVQPFELEINPGIEEEKKRLILIMIHCTKFFSLSQLSDITKKAL